MTHSLFTIGLTGGIASGKTTVSCLFAEQGVPIIDADEVSHALTRRGQPVLNEIADYFGQEIIDDEGNLNRQQLREKVFKNSEQRKYLESILHPRIRQAMQEKMAQVKYAYCILSIPLLIESQRQHTVSRVLVVDCSPDLQRYRLKMRNQFDDAEITRILNAQVDRQTRISAADDIIYNEENRESLKFQVLNLHEKYLQLCEIKR
jgi:dephospho-CoA kinase